MKTHEEVKNWLKKAMNDYKTARNLLSFPQEEIITDTMCFHCQQFVEKSSKAFFIFKNVEFKRTHNLEYLIKLCSDLDPDFEFLSEKTTTLTDYAVKIRHPDEFYIPSVEEAKECFEIALKVKGFIYNKLNLSY
ncbi:MAG: DNA-binding protein [Candidatus Altiarchaeales archaeon A3]|nr:MAG: DNA-binding protein [Candidatus Altiarchaeales archaeon A3]